MTGPGRTAYVLGRPMHVYEGSLHLGSLDPVPVAHHGTEVHVGNFKPSAALRGERQKLAPLILLEIIAFLADNFASVQLISFCLSLQIEVSADGRQVASDRSALLEAIGAYDIQITTHADGEAVGKLAVVAVWEYNETTRALLAARLDKERARWRAGLAALPAPSLRARLQRLVLKR